MKTLIAFFAGLLMIHAIHAQQITGIVVDENSLPIFGANIRWFDTQIQTTSDSTGVFVIEMLPENSGKLVAERFGYKPDTVWVTLADTLQRLLIRLQQIEALEGVEVSAQQVSVSDRNDKVIQTIGLTAKELTKAACCNLSESFSTTAVVDVNFQDAFTGTRQIQMLGLDGKYVQIMRENIPYIRGQLVGTGLGNMPGTFIDAIQVSKGTGSVTQGFESMTGSINLELKKPKTAPPIYINAYINNMLRAELNVDFANMINEHAGYNTFLHASGTPVEFDFNNDNFVDRATGYQFLALHRWKFTSKSGWEGQIAGQFLSSSNRIGELSNSGNNGTDTSLYSMQINDLRAEVFGKLGRIFPNARMQSMGMTFSASHYVKDYIGARNYNSAQQSLYYNFIFQGIIGNTQHRYKTGASVQTDHVAENVGQKRYNYWETVPGIFFEYHFVYINKLDFILGGRLDYSTVYGFFPTPRLHFRYEPVHNTVIRISAGRGQRSPRPFAENLDLFLTARQIIIEESNPNGIYGLQPEISWNAGISLSQKFSIDYRPGFVRADFFYTYFQNKLVVDWGFNPQEIRFYNVQGKSYSLSAQATVGWEFIKRFDARLSYRWLHVRNTYKIGELAAPYVAPHRAFINLNYTTRNFWQFDGTLNWYSAKRLPSTQSNPAQFQRNDYSSNQFLLNLQVSKWLGKMQEWQIYLGAENVLNFKQANPIISADNPFSNYFDASMIWGPINGVIVYAGFRWELK